VFCSSQLTNKSSRNEEEPDSKNKFVINFNLFPDTAHEFKCDGLYASYWASPPEFREKVLESYRKFSSGMFGLPVAPEIWAYMREPQP